MFSIKTRLQALFALPKTLSNLLTLMWQMQQGCDDCVLFAIAFATFLARGEQPGGFFYEQKVMRKHLNESLEKQNITAFPVQKIRCHGLKVRH